MENIEKRLGALVRSLRQAAGMTQEQLAQQLTSEGLPMRQNTVAKLEGGLRPTSVVEFGALAKIFNKSAPELASALFPSGLTEAEETALRAEVAENIGHQAEAERTLESLSALERTLRAELIRLGLRESMLRAMLGRGDEIHGGEGPRPLSELREEFRRIEHRTHGLLSKTGAPRGEDH